MPSLGRDPAELVWRARRRWGSPTRWRCVYCGRRSPRMQVDHFEPFVLGGDSTARNLVPACPECNSAKQDREAAAWMAAVGVPASVSGLLLAIHSDAAWRVSWDYDYPITALDYAAGALVPRPAPRLNP